MECSQNFTIDQINKKLRSLDAKKAIVPYKNSSECCEMLAYIIDRHLKNIINNDFLRNSFSDSAKIASVRPILKT